VTSSSLLAFIVAGYLLTATAAIVCASWLVVEGHPVFAVLAGLMAIGVLTATRSIKIKRGDQVK